MARIGFIGLGNMGFPMTLNLIKEGHTVKAFDLDRASVEAVVANGGIGATSATQAATNVQFVITMLPEGRHVRSVYLGESGDGSDGVIGVVDDDTLLIDCSTIDVQTARAVSAIAAERRLELLDAPVSGGVPGAEAATLTFMVGGSESDFARARPLLLAMGKAAIHVGPSGNGQAAKICNNMLAGIHMIAVSEAFAVAERLGLKDAKLFEVCSQSSGQCWSLTSYCPVPGPVPSSPANRGYEPGFASTLMLKDLRLAQQAAQSVGAATPLGAQAHALYTIFASGEHGDLDFSAIIKMIRGEH